jgi:hypothetical protein
MANGALMTMLLLNQELGIWDFIAIPYDRLHGLIETVDGTAEP